MIRRVLVLAISLAAVSLSVEAQQAKHKTTRHHTAALEQLQAPGAVALSLSQSKILNATGNSLLLQNTPVLAWSDGGRLVSQNAMAEIGMASLDFFPTGYLGPNTFAAVQPGGPAAVRPRSDNIVPDAKDLPDMVPPADRGTYYGGEIGFMYGRWSGKGGGDYLDSYIQGTVGNDKFQITAGAEYENWSGHGQRFHLSR
jgi:hypothetical protein